jgi:hypothetical protein
MQIIRHCFLCHEGQINMRLFTTDHIKTGINGNIELAEPLKKLKLYVVAQKSVDWLEKMYALISYRCLYYSLKSPTIFRNEIPPMFSTQLTTL